MARLRAVAEIRTTGSSSPRRTSSCARRATSSASPRAASRGCGSRRSRSPSIASSRSARATHAEALLDAAGRLDPAAARPGRRARERLAAARRGRRTGQRGLTRAADGGPGHRGTARGIRLAAPGPGTRPLGDRVKQTLFAILEPDLRGRRVLDLFAGSGAAGIEALSRGAARATFVERDKGAAAVIAANLARTRLAGERARIVRARRARAGCAAPRPPRPRPFDVVVARPALRRDRPARRGRSRRSEPLARAAARRVVAKHFWRDPPPAEVGLLASERERRFGETTLTFYRRAGGSMNTVAVYPGLVRPDHQRPSRHRRAAPLAVFDRSSSASSPTRARRRCCPSDDAHRGHPRRRSTDGAGVAARPRRGRRLRRPDRRLLPRPRSRAPSSAACARSATSRPRCSSPTTTGSSRPTSTRSSS